MAASLTTTGNGGIGDTIDWTVGEAVASAIPGESAPSVGSINYTGKTMPNSKLLSDSGLTLDSEKAGNVSGTVSQVDISGPATSLTAFGQMEKFNADFDIPAVESGSIFGALDLATQLTGTKRCLFNYDGGVYWSLQGHSTGFDKDNNRVVARDDSTAKGGITDSPFTVEFVDRVLDIKNGATAYAFNANPHGGGSTSLDQAHLYATEVDGSGMRLGLVPPAAGEFAPGGVVPLRENIVFRLERQAFGYTADFRFSHGYWDTNLGRGVECTVRINTSDNTIRVLGTFNSGTPNQTFNVSQSIAGLSAAKEYQVVITASFTSLLDFRIEASIADVANLGSPIKVQTNLATALADWTSPWMFTSNGGGMRALYQVNTTTDVHAALMTEYEVPRTWRVGQWTGTSFPEEDRPGYPSNMWLKRKSIPPSSIDPFGVPIVGRRQNLWQYLNELCAAARAELAVVKDTIVLRSMDGIIDDADRRIIDISDRTPPSLSISSLGTGLSIDVAYYDTELTRMRANNLDFGVPTKTSFTQLPIGRSGKFYDAQEDEQTITVAVGEVAEVRVQSKGYPTLLYKPVPSLYWDSPAQWLQFKDDPRNGLGTYIVSDSTGLPINFRQWLDFGGDVNVSLDSDSNFITIQVTGPRQEIPSTTGPYSLAQSNGQNTYPSLTIAGRGALGEQKRVNVQTGADPARTKQQVATLIDVASAASISDAFEIAAAAITKASGSFPTISFSIPANQISGFGLTAGSVFYYNNSSYRVTSVSIGRTECQITAEYYLPVGQFDEFWNGTTVEDFDDLYNGFTASDFKVSPLGLE